MLKYFTHFNFPIQTYSKTNYITSLQQEPHRTRDVIPVVFGGIFIHPRGETSPSAGFHTGVPVCESKLSPLF